MPELTNVCRGWQHGDVKASSVFGSTLLVVGSEPLLAERAVRQRIKQATAEQPDAEISEVDAAALADGSFADLIGGSLFASRAVVVVDDLAGLPDAQVDLVKRTALDPHPELCLVLVHGGGTKGKALLDALKPKVQVEKADPIRNWDLPKFVAAEARSLRMSMDAAGAQALVDAVGSDLRTLVGALRQLASDYADQAVDVEGVRRYFGGRAEVTSFSVADDALAGRPGAALEKLRWALATGVAPVLVTSALAGTLRGLGKYLDLRSARLPDNEVARQAGVPPWKLKELSRLARDWSPRGVSSAIKAVAVADEQVKGAAADPGFALEQLVLAVDAARGGRRH